MGHRYLLAIDGYPDDEAETIFLDFDEEMVANDPSITLLVGELHGKHNIASTEKALKNATEIMQKFADTLKSTS